MTPCNILARIKGFLIRDTRSWSMKKFMQKMCWVRWMTFLFILKTEHILGWMTLKSQQNSRAFTKLWAKDPKTTVILLKVFNSLRKILSDPLISTEKVTNLMAIKYACTLSHNLEDIFWDSIWNIWQALSQGQILLSSKVRPISFRDSLERASPTTLYGWLKVPTLLAVPSCTMNSIAIKWLFSSEIHSRWF